MSDNVISVENVTKAYRLGQIGGGTLKEDFARWWAKLRRQPDPFLKIGEERHVRKMGEQFWALNDVSFQVKQGEVLGIIGRNGAGKSTLLKILSQVTTPTSGKIKIKGRIASLLEVGTGFHPELTGRENVFLNGAILGMTKAEIRKKFDEIVAFSEIEEFIDTPVKRYSSGMYVRLAFAVAAHLEPEILICDEVLAVGDAEFQKKCLGKMQDVSTKEGRTVLFVSHNMDSVVRLCSTTVMLDQGRVSFWGETKAATQQYLLQNSQSGRPATWIDLSSAKRVFRGKEAFFVAANYQGLNADGPWPRSDEPVVFKLRLASDREREVNSLAVTFYNLSATKLLNADTKLTGKKLHLRKGENEIELKIERIHIKPGKYLIGLWLANGPSEVFDYADSAFEIDVLDKNNRLGSDVDDDGVVSCDFDVTELR
jgi:lipopolysaccharide transport system ATP-binding protein